MYGESITRLSCITTYRDTLGFVFVLGFLIAVLGCPSVWCCVCFLVFLIACVLAYSGSTRFAGSICDPKMGPTFSSVPMSTLGKNNGPKLINPHQKSYDGNEKRIMGKWFDRLRDQDAPISKWRILDTVTLHGHPNGLSVHSSFMDAMGIPWTLHGLSMDSPWNLH